MKRTCSLYCVVLYLIIFNFGVDGLNHGAIPHQTFDSRNVDNMDSVQSVIAAKVSALQNLARDLASMDTVKLAQMLDHQRPLVERSNGCTTQDADETNSTAPEWDSDIWGFANFKTPHCSQVTAFVPPGQRQHPLWKFERFHLAHTHVISTCVVLLFAGVLCAAGGIGGGGIFVTVLMVLGKLTIADAVPLSKSIVFIGALSGIPVNMKMVARGSPTIDGNLCRLIIPASLAGTYLGVFLNRVLPGWVLAMVLILVLTLLTIMTGQRTIRTYGMERAEKSKVPDEGGQPGPGPGDTGPGDTGSTVVQHGGAPGDDAATSHLQEGATIRTRDIVYFVCLLFVVIFCSTLRYHVQACRLAPAMLRVHRCRHPIMRWMGPNGLAKIAAHTAEATAYVTFFAPLFVCLAAACRNTFHICGQGSELWTLRKTSGYAIMAFSTGTLAALVGIGGGLVFSPFLLIMGHDPVVAVATSSLCVLFTAASTAIQYVLVDRTIIPLVVVYGAIIIFSSVVGTRILHILERSNKKVYIMLVVLLGVFLSLVLAFINLVRCIHSALLTLNSVTS